jgi:hypothetical protein
LPYPGTFVLDPEGKVVSKHFDDSYRDRASGTFLLSQVGGESSRRPYVAEATDFGVAVRLFADELVYRPLQKTVMYIELDLADGLHAYLDPVPDGYTPLSVELSRFDGLETFPVIYPEGHSLVMAGLGEEFSVVDGRASIRVPFKISGSQHDVEGQQRELALEDDLVVLTATVRYQLCSESECFPPSMSMLSVPLVESPLLT